MTRVRGQDVVAALGNLREKLDGNVCVVARVPKALVGHVDVAADMLVCEHRGFSVDESVWITLMDRDVPSYLNSLEHLLRYCVRPPFALERRSVIRDPDGRITWGRYVPPRHKAARLGRGDRESAGSRVSPHPPGYGWPSI